MRLPSFTRSLRFRLSGMTSGMAFGIAVVALVAVYLTLLWSVRSSTIRALVFTGQTVVEVNGRRMILPRITEQEFRTFESLVREAFLNEMAIVTLLVLVGLFVLSLLIGWFVAGRALRPVERIVQVAEDIEATDLSRRIRLDGPDDELRRMARTFDAMLDRLDQAFATQRRFLAQTSHDLRTPLAVIRTNVDVALADPETTEEDWRATAGIVARAAERMSGMIDDLLAAARLEAGSASKVTLDLAGLAEEIAQEVAARVRSSGLRLVTRSAPATVEGDPTALTRAVGNLVDNAIRVAPLSSEIAIAAGGSEGWGYLAVGDRGPGIDPSVLSADPEDRPGMGLLIVQEIAGSHGGTVVAVPRPGGGSWIGLWLPLQGCDPEGEPPVQRLRDL